MPSVTFTADTYARMQAKVREFFGAALSSNVTGWQVPNWAPKGSKWVSRPPKLLGPDGREVQGDWIAGTPQRPKP